MQKVRIAPLASLLVVILLAGCGSNTKSSSSAPSSPAASSTASQSSSTPAPSGSTSATKRAALITTKHGKLGTILATGSKKLTVYLFVADKGPSSSCSGACAKLWPPVIGKPGVAGRASSSDLGEIMRPDGMTQVTYKGHPLYTYAKDKDSGDSYGQAIKSFGASWYVLAPSGKKIDNS